MKKTLYLAASAVTLGAIIALPAQANEETFKKAGCVACHTKDKKMVGPALQDIAKKYKGQADAVAKLSDKVRKGGKDVWGPIPMPPNGADKINDADLKAVVEWVLKS